MKMKFFAFNPEPLDYYKGNELPQNATEPNGSVDTPATHQANGAVDVKPAKDEALHKERERQIEAWMNDIRAFIRNIDVSKL